MWLLCNIVQVICGHKVQVTLFAFIALSATGLVFIHLGLVGASSLWPVLRLVITVVNPFNCCNAEQFSAHKSIFLHNPRLPS